MANIAFLIGVSEYQREQPLPACKADVERMSQLLHATGKYDEIVAVADKTLAINLKDRLRDFFTKYKADAVEEAFFFFSGHGSYNAMVDDVLLCCTDFDGSKPSTTSISNSEIDDLLRLVSPRTAVKLIDACNSGAPYIKDAADGFQKTLEKTKGQFKSVYWMASSKLDQYSYSSADLSYFTEKFIEGALARSSGTVRYRDIQGYVADAFGTKPTQTPFFVTQGTGLEVFADVSEQMVGLAKKQSHVILPSSKDGSTKEALADVISAQDALFVPFDKINESLIEARHQIEALSITDELVANFYRLESSFEGKLKAVPKVRQIAKWAAEKAWDKKFFVTIEQEEYTTEVQVPKLRSWLGLTIGASGDAFETKTEVRRLSRPVSLSATVSMPFETFAVTFQPKKHPSLKPYTLQVAIIPSRTESLLMFAIAGYVEGGWDKYMIDSSSVEWQQASYAWKDVVNTPKLIWERLFTEAVEFVHVQLESLLPAERSKNSDAKNKTAAPVVTGPTAAASQKK